MYKVDDQFEMVKNIYHHLAHTHQPHIHKYKCVYIKWEWFTTYSHMFSSVQQFFSESLFYSEWKNKGYKWNDIEWPADAKETYVERDR